MRTTKRETACKDLAMAMMSDGDLREWRSNHQASGEEQECLKRSLILRTTFYWACS